MGLRAGAGFLYRHGLDIFCLGRVYVDHFQGLVELLDGFAFVAAIKCASRRQVSVGHAYIIDQICNSGR